MKTAAETGLASHSSNMVAPRDFNRETEEGWTVVTSKRTLLKIRKAKKNIKKNYKNNEKVASSDDVSMETTPSNESTWSSIVKRSLKMDVPRVSIEIASTSSASKQSNESENEVQYLKTVHACGAKVQPSKVSVPQEIITVLDSDEASISESKVSEDERTPSKKVCATSTVQQENPKNNEGSMLSLIHI